MNHSNETLSAVVQHQVPMDPLPTSVRPSLKPLRSIRAVIFDVYGTLLISGSGEVGAAVDPPTVDDPASDAGVGERLDPVRRAIGAVCGVDVPVVSKQGLIETIVHENDAHRGAERPNPEVEILDIWDKFLNRQEIRSLCGVSHWDARVVSEVAARYESIANPTWPMPSAAKVITELRNRDFRLGIVSNAQVFTIDLVQALSDAALADGPFDLDLCVFSNRFRQSKPGPRLFDVLVRAMEKAGIAPEQAVYVGNDMLNDVWAAGNAGLKTAWYAGDRRSLRDRANDPRCRDKIPDLVVTELTQLLDCLG
ncbi:HAD family hydrolase [Crateriforma spongiae]|uniref:HAD family hydrolase n=1 Tax=Crateriforma spongiae TaxID=2724528 RepID=UPI0014474301|nr:HAD family hydrolase [Crateriforma spongiae]